MTFSVWQQVFWASLKVFPFRLAIWVLDLIISQSGQLSWSHVRGVNLGLGFSVGKVARTRRSNLLVRATNWLRTPAVRPYTYIYTYLWWSFNSKIGSEHLLSDHILIYILIYDEVLTQRLWLVTFPGGSWIPVTIIRKNVWTSSATSGTCTGATPSWTAPRSAPRYVHGCVS